MNVLLRIRNESQRKRLYRSDALRRLAHRICAGEGVDADAELSVLLCDDPFIRNLNRTYRNKDVPTDVLAFTQPPRQGSPGPTVLGDIVISLEAVERHCANAPNRPPDRRAMCQELRLLFCHGLLHLLGSDHDTAAARKDMNAKQARYLGITTEAAWRKAPKHHAGP